jgi:hypothetical protein
MMREIALKRGNFRGVCPRIGRLRGPCHGVDRLAGVKPACFVPVLFMSKNDTHDNVDESFHRTKRDSKTKSTSYVFKEEQPNGSSERNDPHSPEGL